MKVGDILRQKTARIATVRMNETVGIAAQLMRASNISALVVKDVVRTEGNTAVGMFTERDVVRAIAEHGAAGVNLKVVAVDFSAATGVLLLDRYAGTGSSSHEQEPHPPSACDRQLQPDRRHQHARYQQSLRRRGERPGAIHSRLIDGPAFCHDRNRAGPTARAGKPGQPAFPRLPRNRTCCGHAKIDANDPERTSWICRSDQADNANRLRCSVMPLR